MSSTLMHREGPGDLLVKGTRHCLQVVNPSFVEEPEV